jgi:RNA polymerase sigma-54 factor
MSLLLLSNTELRDKVMAELSANPALELVEEVVCPTCKRPLKRPGHCPACSLDQLDQDPIVFLSPRESIRPTRPVNRHQEQLPDQEPTAPEDITTYVLQQLASDLDPTERNLAIYILSSLDEDGFLQDHPAILARTTRTSLNTVHRVIDLISHVDPPGLATPGPRQALLIQLDLFHEDGPVPKVAKRILESCFNELGRREIEKIASRLDISTSRVRQAATYIQENLNPYPGRAYWGSGRQPPGANPMVYHVPDVLITHNASDEFGPLVVEIFAPISGWLRVNPLFSKAKSGTNGDQAEDWTKHIDRASLFVKCLQQRNNTMRRLMQILVNQQRKFILDGDRFLIPMTRAELADQIGVHESTVSRAVANKSVALPDGRIIPMSRFFDRSLSVRDKIKEIVRDEIKPLTDQQIAEILQVEGIKIARRTVAKYRAIDGILPARLRQRHRDRIGS